MVKHLNGTKSNLFRVVVHFKNECLVLEDIQFTISECLDENEYVRRTLTALVFYISADSAASAYRIVEGYLKQFCKNEKVNFGQDILRVVGPEEIGINHSNQKCEVEDNGELVVILV